MELMLQINMQLVQQQHIWWYKKLVAASGQQGDSRSVSENELIEGMT
jgi:hypothetical protein